MKSNKTNEERLSMYKEELDKIDEISLHDITSATGLDVIIQVTDYLKSAIDGLDVQGQGVAVDKKLGQIVKEVQVSTDKLKRYIKTNKNKLKKQLKLTGKK